MTFRPRTINTWISCLLLSFILLGCNNNTETPENESVTAAQQSVSETAEDTPSGATANSIAVSPQDNLNIPAESADTFVEEGNEVTAIPAPTEDVVVADPPLDEPQEAKPDGFDYYAIGLNQLQFDNGRKLPSQLSEAGPDIRLKIQNGVVQLIMDMTAEGYMAGPQDAWNVHRNPSSRILLRRQTIGTELVIRVPEGKAVSGTLLINTKLLEDNEASEQTFTAFRFTTEKGTADSSQEVRDAYWLARAIHYKSLLDADLPGAAWFRNELRVSRSELANLTFEQDRIRRRSLGSSSNEIADTYALMSGGRALSENLQLDRELPPATDLDEVVPVESIPGITVREFDWTPLVDGLDPELDPLAPLIPADQHVLFYPSFKALIRVIDETSENGAPVLNITQTRAEDAESQSRYETQLGISLDGTARLLGPTIIRSVAITGGDLYLRTGTDVALLFESFDAPALLAILLSQADFKAADYPGAKEQKGTIGDIPYDGIASEDRVISTYMAVLGNAVVVTNSTVQMKRLIDTFQERQQSLVELDEYVFFRNRYPLGNPDQAGLLILSDQTIRRWCGPRWRIASARRTQAIARMTQLQAELLDELVAGTATASFVEKKSKGQFLLSANGIRSANYGSLDFQTPINELSLEKVSPEERRLYEGWRSGYQRQWSNFFDPIAIEFTLSDQRLGADMTVMPLIDRSEYQEMIQLSRGATLDEDAGDRHPEAIAHAVIALNRESHILRQNLNMLGTIAPQISINPLSWLGDEVTIYADKSELWDELAGLSEREMDNVIEENLPLLPVGIGIGVSNGIKLTLFLTGVRAFIEQAAPGMTNWGIMKYKDQAYAVVRPSTQARGDLPPGIQDIALYYRTTGKQLLLSLNEDIIKRSIDRQLAQPAGDLDAADPAAVKVLAPWIGDNVGLQLGPTATSFLKVVEASNATQAIQPISWSNIPILNEWHRRYPDEDPVELHRKFWQRRLVCPGGGEYRWNEELRTMESTVYGCPAAPLPGPGLPAAIMQITAANLGLSFEPNGLRARIELDRKQ